MDIDLSAGYSRFRLVIQGVNTAASGDILILRISTDGGSSFITTSTYGFYVRSFNITGGSISTSNTSTGSFLRTGGSISGLTTTYVDMGVLSSLFTISGTGVSNFNTEIFGGRIPTVSAANAIRISALSGDLSAGTFALYGYKESV